MTCWDLSVSLLMQTVFPQSTANLNFTRAISGDGSCVVLLALFLRLVAVVFVLVRDLLAVSGCRSEFRTVSPNWSCWFQFVPVLGLVKSASR